MNKIIKGDCLELIETIKDKSINLVFTSPPYKTAYENAQAQKFHYSMDYGEPLYIIEDIAKKIIPKLKDDGFLLVNWATNQKQGALRPYYVAQRIVKQGWFCNEIFFWVKNNPIPNTAKQLTNAVEYVFIFSKYPTYKLPIEKRAYIKNVFKTPVSKGETEHNATFPLELAKHIINIFSKEKDIVLDTFVGSGTTALACKQLNRQYLGFEINPEYIKICNKRLQQQILK